MTKTHDTTQAELERQELLVVRCQLGEPEAFDELVATWHEPLWRYLRRSTGDPDQAEEILQDAWLRILRGIDRLRDTSRLRSWLFTIAHRAFTDRLRRRYADGGLEPLDDEHADATEVDPLVWEDHQILHHALGDLPPPDRETVVLFYLEELDLREVAEILGIPVGTVKSRLHRARRQLRGRLEAKGVSR